MFNTHCWKINNMTSINKLTIKCSFVWPTKTTEIYAKFKELLAWYVLEQYKQEYWQQLIPFISDWCTSETVLKILKCVSFTYIWNYKQNQHNKSWIYYLITRCGQQEYLATKIYFGVVPFAFITSDIFILNVLW